MKYPERGNYKKRKERDEGASAEFKLIYDSTSETLEPVYFWILDFMNDMFGKNLQKINWFKYETDLQKLAKTLSLDSTPMQINVTKNKIKLNENQLEKLNVYYKKDIEFYQKL